VTVVKLPCDNINNYYVRPHKDVNKILKEIMVKLPKVHEQQTMWMLLAVSKSTAQDPEDPVQRGVPAGQEPKAGAVDSRGL